MWTTRDEYFHRISFSFLDSGYLKEIGAGEFVVYLALRRFTWRTSKGDLGAWWDKGMLACKVSQPEIAEMTGMGLATVERKIARLKKLGWVKSERMEGKAGKAVVYVIGQRIEATGTGLRGELFWADALFERWADEKVGDREEPEPLKMRVSSPQKEGFIPSNGGDEPLKKRVSKGGGEVASPDTEKGLGESAFESIDKGNEITEGKEDRGGSRSLSLSSVEKLIGREAREGAHACTVGPEPGTNGRFKTAAGVRFFRESFLCKWKLGLLPTVGNREKKHVKDLIEKWGEADFKRVVEYLMEHFPRLRKRFNWTDAFPSIRLLFAFRDPLRGCLEASPLAAPNDRWTEETAGKSPDVGWS